MFSKKKIDLLKKIYDIDTSQDAFVIKILIKEYTDIFNDLDPAPLKKRDINQALLTYLDDCSSDIPLRYKINLVIVCPKRIKNNDKEKKVAAGLKVYFSLYILLLKKKINMAYQKSIQYLFIFIVFFSSSYYLGSKNIDNIITNTLIEGLSIGGWVFLWEAIALVFFKNRETSREEKKYKRLEASLVEFEYI